MRLGWWMKMRMRRSGEGEFGDCMILSTRLVMVIVVGIAMCRASRGETPSEKFASQINAYKENAAARKGTLDNLDAIAQPLGDSGKKDMALITAFMLEQSDSWSKAAEAL